MPDPRASDRLRVDARPDVISISRGASFQSPVWSPDGQSIAFRRRTALRVSAVTPDRVSEVGLMAPDGSEQVTLAEDESELLSVLSFRTVDGPTWSPDSRSLAFASQRDSGQWAVWTVSRTGGQLRRLIPDLAVPHFEPSWSPHDATMLAYVAEVNGVRDIFLFDAAQPSRRDNLTEGLRAELGIVNPDSPRWSPDGTRLAFSAYDALEGGDEEVYVLELSTLTAFRVTDDDAMDSNATWSPDGQSLLITSNRAGPESGASAAPMVLDLWRVGWGTGAEPLRLTTAIGLNAEPDWYSHERCAEEP
jgi:Tol biopolymer transport system component